MRSSYALFFTVAIVASLCVNASLAQEFHVSWQTIDAGGAMSTTGGVFELSGTIGQPEAGSFAEPIAGGVFALVGGFWSVAATAAPHIPGDLDGDCDVDLGDLSSCLSGFGCIPPAVCVCDIDGDGDADLADLAALLASFGTTCP